MPPIKEIRYFNPIFSQVKATAEKLLRWHAEGRTKTENFDERDLEFLSRMATVPSGPTWSVENYKHLFEPAGSLVTGDITPAYHALDSNRISELASALPHCRFVFFLRDPIARLWSQVTMRIRTRKTPASMFRNRRRFENNSPAAICQPVFPI
jgi:hypothetical protein